MDVFASSLLEIVDFDFTVVVPDDSDAKIKINMIIMQDLTFSIRFKDFDVVKIEVLPILVDSFDVVKTGVSA